MSRIKDLEQDLNVAWRRLQAEWSEVRNNWRDSVAENFERDCWDELEMEVPLLLKAMEELDETINQAALQLE